MTVGIYYTKYLQISLKFTNYSITVLNNLKQELRFNCSGKNAFELAIYIRDSLVSWTLMLALCKDCQKQLLDASTATSFKYLQHQFIKFIYIYKFQMVHYIKYYIICILNIQQFYCICFKLPWSTHRLEFLRPVNWSRKLFLFIKFIIHVLVQ